MGVELGVGRHAVYPIHYIATARLTILQDAKIRGFLTVDRGR